MARASEKIPSRKKIADFSFSRERERETGRVTMAITQKVAAAMGIEF